MDATTGKLVDFALRADYAALDAATVHACKVRLIDTFASAMGAYDDPLSQRARAIAKRSTGTPGASVWGDGTQTTLEAATFANGVMVRFLDVSDTYLGMGGGHPSDMISGLLAVGEALHADGTSVINALAIAYDVYCSLNDVVDISAKGWDQTLYAVLGTALGVGKLMRLTREQLANAVSLALTPNMALRETRQGDISCWKGCAGANAARNAVFAAMLAQEGFSGPPDAFEGKQGLWNALGRFEWPLPEGPGATRMVTQTHIKSLPICYHGQSAVLCALALRGQLRLEDVSEIHVESYRGAVAMMGGDPTRWAPTTRETADHSLPYCIAIALLDGEISVGAFAPERLADSAVKAVMAKVKVSASPEMTFQYPEGSPGRVTIRLASGQELRHEIKYPIGHAKNPMSDAAVEAKFRDMFRAHGDADRCRRILAGLWDFERAADVGNVIKLLQLSNPK